MKWRCKRITRSWMLLLWVTVPWMSILWITVASMTFSINLAAQEVSSSPSTSESDYSPINQFKKSSVTLAQMGRLQGISLRGGQHQAGINFTLPDDEVVMHAQLVLNLKVSPALAKRNATLQLMINGQPLGTVPLVSGTSDITSYQIDIPALQVTSSNNLSFKVSDESALMCQRPFTDQYQVTILPTTHIDLEGQQLNVTADLSHLPRPFFDSRQMTPGSIAIALPATFTPSQVSAATLIASWFGIQADYRGVSFAVLTNSLPKKNGILIGAPGEKIGGITLPNSTEPLLTIIKNPVNPIYKLLLIIGKDKTQLRNAAWRLTQGEFALNTAAYQVSPQHIPESKPYDAPRWISTKKPIYLSELIRKDQSMTVTGIWHDVLHVTFRAAPDLFLWDGDNIPMHVNYRFPSEPWIDEENSFLNLTFNGKFLRNLPVDKQGGMEHLWKTLGGDTRQEKADIPIEPYMIYGDNQLSFYFKIALKNDAPCDALLGSNIKSRLEPDSWIDLSHTRHFAQLPNLSYFVGASFPFSRQADYTETAILLSEHPTNTQIAILLDLAARSGNETGTTLNYNRIFFGEPSTEADQQYVHSRDILVISTLGQTTFNHRLLADSPFELTSNTLGVRHISGWQQMLRWLQGNWNLTSLKADRYLSSNQSWRGFISYRSPWNAHRVVVMAIGSSDTQLSRLPQDLVSPQINAGIRGDAAIITDGNGVRSFRVAPTFPSGQLPWHMMVIWYANQHSAILAIFCGLICLITGLTLFRLLKHRSRKRLNQESGS